jgi:GDP-mannose transporter
MSDEDDPSSSSVMFSIVFYTVCSSVMLVANKLALHYNPVPALVVCAQVAATVGFILILRATGLSEVDTFDWPRVKVFLPYTLSFVLVLYSNGRAIQHSNVETVIVFRACTPLIVSGLDYALLGREMPSYRSLASLAGMAVSVVGYALSDSEFLLNGISAYGWVTLYVLSVVFETTYGKKICQGVKFNAPVWGQVMYCNAIGLLPLLGVAFVAGEPKYLETNGVNLETKAWMALLASCFVGVGIAWAVWNCRNQVAATTFTLIGVVCKLLSVMLNVFIWDKHATPIGIIWLVVCLGCSSMYRQSPMRLLPAAPDVAVEEGKKVIEMESAEVIGNEEEQQTLMGSDTPSSSRDKDLPPRGARTGSPH